MTLGYGLFVGSPEQIISLKHIIIRYRISDGKPCRLRQSSAGPNYGESYINPAVGRNSWQHGFSRFVAGFGRRNSALRRGSCLGGIIGTKPEHSTFQD